MKKLSGGFDKRAAAGSVNSQELQYEGSSPLVDILHQMEAQLPAVFDREMVIVGSEQRKLYTPSTETKAGTVKGTWKESAFVFDDNYIPEKHNASGSSIADIKKNLSDTYGIHLNEIPYVNGVADFSSISVANIPTCEIIKKATGMTQAEYDGMSQLERTKLFQDVFSDVSDGSSKRNRNFDFADQIAAEKQIPIPGLSEGYTAADLNKWRIKNKFSWDEQIHGGYCLVPAVIHGNLAHTGLVGTAKSAYSYLESSKDDIKQNPERYCLDEETAPISIEGLASYSQKSYVKKGGKNMAMHRSLSRGMNLGRYEIGYDEVHAETGEQVAEGDRLHELGVKFEADKDKLENALERIRALNLKDEDKEKMIAETEAAIEALRTQYKNDVKAEQDKVHKKIEEQLELMDQAVDELSEQSDYLRGISMDAAATDAAAVADASDEKKQEFERLKDETNQKLIAHIAQAEMQLQNILDSRKSDR